MGFISDAKLTLTAGENPSLRASRQWGEAARLAPAPG